MTYKLSLLQGDNKFPPLTLYRVYQNDWSGLEVDYIHKYGEET